MKIAKILRTTFFIEQLWWMLLDIFKTIFQGVAMVGCFRIAVYLFNHVTEEHEIGMSSKSFQKARKASSCVKAGKTIWSEQIFLTFEKFWCSLSYIKA